MRDTLTIFTLIFAMIIGFAAMPQDRMASEETVRLAAPIDFEKAEAYVLTAESLGRSFNFIRPTEVASAE